jgi:hypothetical protein
MICTLIAIASVTVGPKVLSTDELRLVLDNKGAKVYRCVVEEVHKDPRGNRFTVKKKKF